MSALQLSSQTHFAKTEDKKISQKIQMLCIIRASDFFQDWWAEVTHEAKNGESSSEMIGPSISN